MKLYEGKSKIVYTTKQTKTNITNSLVNLYFKDDVTAFNGEKHDTIAGKGKINCKISAFFMEMFKSHGINTHYVELLDAQTQLCRIVEIIPIEVVVRNAAAGSLCRRFGVEKGMRLPRPLVEFFYKSDEHGDPPMSRSHALLFNMATNEEMDYMETVALQVNEILVEFWNSLAIDLIDFKIEFGRAGDDILLADEMTPDACRLWKSGTQTSMDKDVYRYGLGDLGETYQTLYEMIETVNNNEL